MRDQTVAMLRIKNEARWIRRNIQRAIQVCQYAVVFDDGSTDGTLWEALRGVQADARPDFTVSKWGIRQRADTEWGPTEIHILQSPFAGAIQPRERISEIRDRNILWSYVKCMIPFKHVLCLDGDEMLTLEALRNWPQAIAALEENDTVIPGFIYLWDDEGQRRVDGWYGDLEDGHPRARFQRLFTVKRLSEDEVFELRFPWKKNGIHGGSVPSMPGWPATGWVMSLPIIHFGYLDAKLRQKKFEFYNKIDPNNEWEDRYRHCIGEPSRHAPGPVELVPWRDE